MAHKNKFYIVHIFGDIGELRKSFKVTRFEVRFFYLFLSIFIASVIVMIFLYNSISNNYLKIEELTSENQALRTENQIVNNIRYEYEKLQRQNTKIRAIFENQIQVFSDSSEQESLSENLPLSKIPSLKPLNGKIISRFSEEKTLKGIKIEMEESENIIASGEGTVVLVDTTKTYGRMLILKHSGGFFSLYGNCDEIFVRRNEKVNLAQNLGKVSVKKSNSFLYFEVWQNDKFFDPESLFIGN